MLFCLGKARLLIVTVISAPIVLFGANEALAVEYKMSVGDTIDVNAIGVPDLKQKLTIGIDGQISIALIGVIKAEGLSIRELQERIQQSLTRTTFRLKVPGSNEFTALDPQEVSVSIAEYRNIFVSGDVGKPGRQTFTPGLTNRQAISEAGGCDLARFGIQNPILLSADIRGEYDRAWLEFASESVNLKRIEAELDDKDNIMFNGDTIPVSPTLLDNFVRAAKDILYLRLNEQKAQKIFFERQRDLLGERVATLDQQRLSEEQGMRLDEQEASRIAAQAERGISAVNRVAEARRVSLISATRALQIGVAAATARRDQEQTIRDETALLSKRREELFGAAQDATSKIQAIRIRLQIAADKLFYAGLARVQMSRGSADPELMLVRKKASGVEQSTPQIDEEMAPGDVIRVRCNLDFDKSGVK